MSETTTPGPAAGRRFRRTRARLAGLLARTGRWPAWWPAVLCAVLGTLAGTGYGLLATPQYAATAYVVVVPAEKGDPASALGFAQAYGRVATSGGVLTQARADADVPLATLRGGVQSATSPDAPMIEISGTAGRPEQAATFANAVAEALTEDGNKATKSTGVSLVLFAEALPPASPASPSAPLAAAVGGCAGGLLGALLLLVRPRPADRRPSAVVPAPASPEAPTAPVPSWDSPPAPADTARATATSGKAAASGKATASERAARTGKAATSGRAATSGTAAASGRAATSGKAAASGKDTAEVSGTGKADDGATTGSETAAAAPGRRATARRTDEPRERRRSARHDTTGKQDVGPQERERVR